VSFGGRLETLELSTLLQTLGVSNANGRLTLTRLDRHAALVFRNGRVVFVAGGSSEETMGALLLRMGLLKEPDLMKALERQHDGNRFLRLGEVLVEMGLLAPGTIDGVVRHRMNELVAELLRWNTGFFRFVPTAESGPEEAEVHLGDLVVPEGVPPLELLMHATAVLEAEPSSPPPPAPGAPDVRTPVALPALDGPEPIDEPSVQPPAPASKAKPRPTLSDTGSYTADFSGEVVLLLLRFASQVLARAVAFVLDGEAVRGVGQFGLQTPGRAPAEVVGETVISLREPSILRTAVMSRKAYVGALEPTRLNLKLIKRLGGILPREALAMPLVVRGEVHLVLYGDNAAEGRAIGPLDSLEAAAARAARILERTIAARERGEVGS
jgi:Domain of unknown function (DUF4388)